MKVMKKIAMLFLAVCLTVPCFSMLTFAANGEIQFTDPSGKAGNVVEVTCAIKTAGSAIGDVNLEISYDDTMLEFKTGPNVSISEKGVLKYSGKGTGSENVLRFTMSFMALKEGTTKLEVKNYKAWLYSDEMLECQKGNSTVTIAAGENAPTAETPQVAGSDLQVVVNGQTFTLAANIPDSVLPEGFAVITQDFEGQVCTFAKNETSGMYLAYLLDEEKNGAIYVYNEEDATFSPFELVEISPTTFIILLSDATGIVLPEEFTEMNLTVNGQEYPAWQKADAPANYILYAVNNQGSMSLYQYDSAEGTYQRMEMPTVEEKEEDTFVNKMKNVVTENFGRVLVAVALILVIFLVLLIVLAVKLCNRNRELDELYDEYEIDLDVEELETKKHEARAVAARKEDDDEDEGLSMEDFQYDDDEFEIDFDSALNEEEEPEEEEEMPKKMIKEESTFEDLDFDLDFIDLDD